MIIVVESKLHRDLKSAVQRHLAIECVCSYESTLEAWGGAGSLRADVYYQRCGRRFYVECETSPQIKRLQDKGRRRNRCKDRNMYLLLIPEQFFDLHDWDTLRGYFDQIIAYDVIGDRLTHRVDLRRLGWVRDTVLDAVIPIVSSREARNLRYFVLGKIHHVKWIIRKRVQCTLCRLNLSTPWIFCPRDDCPNSVSYIP